MVVILVVMAPAVSTPYTLRTPKQDLNIVPRPYYSPTLDPALLLPIWQNTDRLVAVLLGPGLSLMPCKP